jgi:N-acetylglutamate synthase-like GNAT family acetyltransferase
MIVRTASTSDCVAISSLLVQLGYPRTPSFVEDQLQHTVEDGYQVLVADDSGTVVGFASMHWFSMFHTKKLMGRITAICVSEHVRAQGIGGLLLVEAEKFLLSRECEKVEVTSNLSREFTHRFYLSHGYEENSRHFMKRL